MKRTLLIITYVLSLPCALGQTYYVSTAGSDLNAGTLEQPFRSIGRGVEAAVPGTTIYVRGDTFSVVTTLTISRSGTYDNMCSLLGYPGERPLLDCSAMAVAGSNRGINIAGSYWHIKGIDIAGAGDNGMRITGQGNIVEFCTFSGNHDTGLQLDNGAWENRIINCDSFNNADPGQGNADGFAPKLAVGMGNSFYGCRAWQNADDGWDGYLRGTNDVLTSLVNCWAFRNGYLADGSPSAGNGNGFKMGGSDDRDLAHNMHLVQCLAFDNRVKGFDQNNNRGSMSLVNCTAYRNGTNYSVNLPLDTGKTLTVTNCIAMGPLGTLGTFAVQATNSWLPPLSASEADFLSLDTSGVCAPRKPDGSLPDVPFMHLAPVSGLIDAGTNIGIAYAGLAPDLGAFEVWEPDNVLEASPVAEGFALYQNYPNPFNPRTEVRSQMSEARHVKLAVYDLLGREVRVLVDGRRAAGSYEDSFDASGLASGVYVYRMSAGSFVQTRTMFLLK